MTTTSKKVAWHRNHNIVAIIAFIMVSISVSVIGSTFRNAEAMLVPLEEHWKYHVDWIWDNEKFRTVGIITPQIIIQNETANKLEGYIADQNGTRISVYDGEQYVMVRYGYDNGFQSKWVMGDKIYDGYITIEIPEQYKDADVVGIYVGNHHYVVDDGTLLVPQSNVFINSARLDYRTNSTLVTEVASEDQVVQHVKSPADGGSLIDWILFQYGILSSSPIGGSNSGK